MRIRVLFRTHYQVAPEHFLLLVQTCSNPVRSDYPERVASRLAKAADFNVDAALYAVELARHADILTDRMLWTPLGLLVGLVTRPSVELEAGGTELTPEERIVVLRLFLESDGACLLWLAGRFLESQRILATEESSNPIAQTMFLGIYAEYLGVIQSPSERQKLRLDSDRLRRDGFSGKTGKHKMWLHLEILEHAYLCERDDGSGSRCYVAHHGAQISALRTLRGLMKGVLDLEKRASDGELCDVACEVMRPVLKQEAGPILEGAVLIERLRTTVRRVRELGINLCPISTLVDAVKIQATAEGLVAPTGRDIRNVLQRMSRDDPQRVRFHVDRHGKPAFIVLED